MSILLKMSVTAVTKNKNSGFKSQTSRWFSKRTALSMILIEGSLTTKFSSCTTMKLIFTTQMRITSWVYQVIVGIIMDLLRNQWRELKMWLLQNNIILKKMSIKLEIRWAFKPSGHNFQIVNSWPGIRVTILEVHRLRPTTTTFKLIRGSRILSRVSRTTRDKYKNRSIETTATNRWVGLTVILLGMASWYRKMTRWQSLWIIHTSREENLEMVESHLWRMGCSCPVWNLINRTPRFKKRGSQEWNRPSKEMIKLGGIIN